MSPLKPLYRLYEWYISRNLRSENMPKHVAIIMDGNRRYSKIQGNIDAIEGHKMGIGTLERVLDWCVDLDIEMVTAYAFSTRELQQTSK